MSSVVIAGDVSGTVTLQAPSAAGTTTLTLPATSGTVLAPSGGVLGISGGGNNSTATPTAGAIHYGDGTSWVASAVGTTGQVLQSNGASAPSWVTMGSGLPGVQAVLFTASGSWTVPSGVTRCIVTVVGGGGGGASFYSVPGGYGGVAVAAVTGISGTISITVGAGGAKDSAGGTSSFGSYVSATGGAGGASTAGVGTVTSGTTIRTGDASTGVLMIQTVGQGTVATSASGVTYTQSGGYMPGTAGRNNPSTNAYGGVSGVVLIEY